MQVKVDGETVFEIADFEKKVICNDIPEDIFDEDMKRRVRWIVEHKLERCMHRLKEEWLPKLKGRVGYLPIDERKLAELIFSQPDYKCRKTREDEAKRLEEEKALLQRS